MPDGTVVVVSGKNIKRYDGDWTLVGQTNGQSSAANLVVLNDGRMVLVGGGVTAVESHAPDFQPTAPGRPEQITMELAYGLLLVRWQPPLSNGGFPISRYTVTYTPGEEPIVLNGSEWKWAFFALADGVEYTVTVQAETIAGAGPASSPLSMVFTVPPGPPRNVTAVAGDGSATVTWDAPEMQGAAPILFYVIFDEAHDVWVDVPGDVEVTEWEVEHLTPGETYQFEMKAINAAGFGAHSEPSAPVSPQ